ncbi:hypothetical protein ABL78_2753 [Leptomonas seymouri]|uniref:Uncharacterized protein n=1 Tax=Leptomonas seymouri TaxID=5684 RepID=A0A0N0P6Y6_LEPSE|nr:hypothetical protein ABL78_2753 [Leptomonas seymouri]|eukprot:KPI88176.1 hypothetical protein ABL78_2753 [Leptomonas seymouri]
MSSPPSTHPSRTSHQLASNNAGAETACSASRKSSRRGDGEEDAPTAAHPGSSSFLKPSPPLDGWRHATGVSPAPPVQMLTGDYAGWGASLAPRGYTAACHGATQEALHTHSLTRPRDDTVAPAEVRPSHSSSSYPPPLPQVHSHRRKRLRTEQVSFTSLYKEVFIYLDAVAATQQDHQLEMTHSQGGAEEDVQAERERSRSSTHRTHHRTSAHSCSASTLSPPHFSPFSSPAFAFASAPGHTPTGASSVIGPGDVGGGPATPPTTALHMSVDAAVEDTLRVLRACWEYRGVPHDAFEPVRLLSPITVHLLTTYGHHTITNNGEYVVLRGGAEQLPWVGCLSGILESYVYGQHQQSRHLYNDDGYHCGAGGPADAAKAEATASPVQAYSHRTDCMISRVLLLNCHSFGWLDHVGSDEYERSHRRLYQAREALVSLLEDERYAALGWPAPCPLCSTAMAGGDASTSVLLGDTIVMEGGAPSLGLASTRNTFTAHYQYGRGIACCVPEQRRPASRKQSTPTNDQQRGSSRIGGGGDGPREEAAQSGLCAMHRLSVAEARRRGSPALSAQQSPNIYQVEEEGPPHRSSGNNGVSRMPHVPPPSACFHLSSSPFDVSHFPPVCCGTCRAAGVLGQAVLLGPTGPLIIQLQFEEREWLEAAAPLMGVAGGGMGGGLFDAPVSRGGLTLAETTAVCPAPLVNTTSLRSDPAGALAAVLYAQMQGYGTTGLAQTPCSTSTVGGSGSRSSVPAFSFPPPPLTTIPSGGTVSLAEFVEWLVRLLHAPPPSLVVEWHSCAPTPSVCGATPGEGCRGGYTESSGDRRTHSSSPGVDASSSAPLTPCGSPTTATQPRQPGPSSAAPVPHPAYANTAPAAHGAARNIQSSSASPTDPLCQHQPFRFLHSDNNNNSSGSPSPPLPLVPLGMSVHPRLPIVPQLLETYADVMKSLASTNTASLRAAAAAETSGPSTDVSRTFPSTLSTHHDLHSMLSRASMQVMEQDQVLLEWVLAIQDTLRPCEATAYFDGVERPLVLAKALEVVTEGERYVNASSVVTSLQFRPRLVGL